MRGRALRVMALGTILLCLLLNPVYAQEKVKVTLWSIGDENGTYAAVFNKLIPKIEEQLPHIDIEVEYNSNEEKFTVALAGGVAPDIIILATRSAGKFVEAGLLAPIDREVFGVETDEELRGLFYGGAIGSMWMSDDVYFMPTEVTTVCFAYTHGTRLWPLLSRGGPHPGIYTTTWYSNHSGPTGRPRRGARPAPRCTRAAAGPGDSGSRRRKAMKKGPPPPSEAALRLYSWSSITCRGRRHVRHYLSSRGRAMTT